jgi:hypothetical protein
VAATDVIFRIGTIGVTKAQAEFGAIVAVLYSMGKAIVETGKRADEISDAFERMTTDQKKAVQEMDSAVKGFIPSIDNMRAAVKMAEAGMRPTEAQMKALAITATDMALKMGEGPEGAKRRLDALTDSIVKGNERGLKPYGITLDSTGTLLEKQAEALAKVTDRAKALKPEITDLDDKWAAFGNTFDKSIALVWDAATKEGGIFGFVGTALDGVNEGLTKYNKLAIETGGETATLGHWIDFVSFSMDVASLKTMIWTRELFGLTEGANQARQALYLLAQQHAKEIQGMKDKALQAGYEEDNYSKSPLADQDFGVMTLESAQEKAAKKKKPSGGGGGGRRRPKYESAELPPTLSIKEIEETVKITDTMYESAEIAKGALYEVNQELWAQNEYLKEINGAETERISLLTQKRDIDVAQLSRDEKIELWTYEEEHARQMIEYEAERAAFLKKESTFYEDLMETGKAFGREDQLRKSLMTKSWGLLTGAAGTYMKALWNGSESAGKAVRRMIHDTLEGYSIEYGIKALAEVAETIIAAASYRYDAAAQHSAAAAQCVAVSVAAAGGAALMGMGLAGGGGGQARASGGGYSGGGGGGFSSYGGSSAVSAAPQEIVVNISGDLAGVLNALTVEARRQKKSGTYQGGF